MQSNSGQVFDLAITILAAITVGLYAWSTRAHFRRGTGSRGISVVLAAFCLSLAICLVLLWASEQPLSAQLAGAALMLAGIALFWWAIVASREARLAYIFDKDKPAMLLVSGPYAHVRHPFYASYILFWSGLALATWNPYALGPVIVMTVIFTKAARVEEQKFSDSALGDQYSAYRQRAGMFWPKLG